ncbi:MAG: hypothetical protein QOJ65_809 [Fimbriimonadaceae bacterium]|nr:hypothetical protein [Fimbriimonadaceae bacterium]
MKAADKVRRDTYVGPVYVGEMSMPAARNALNTWWGTEKARPIVLKSPHMVTAFKRTPEELGVRLDVAASLNQVPRGSIFDVFGGRKPTRVNPVVAVDGSRFERLKKKLDGATKKPSEARVAYTGGKIVLTPETSSAEADTSKLGPQLASAVLDHKDVEIAFIPAPKRIPDEMLAGIDEVASEFTTRFSTAKRTRCSNIKLASSKLNGIILLPGERVSFNESVGRRTAKNGFQIAGVYKNGKHDVDIGGGICQVSSTLYNAALFADLKIVKRQNHSMPVPYVPVGQDATVDYGSIDLVIENNYEKPIAISSEYHPGSLTFRVLGEKDPGRAVKIESDGRERWDAGTKLIVDPTLAAGKTKVVDKGASGQAIQTYRVVYKNGKEVRRETLGRSYYRGGQKIIAVGPGKTQTRRTAPNSGMRLTSSNSN